ncbi:hypothetical protein [Dactylosporangium cerinum]
MIETVCADLDEHRRRVETRDSDLPGWVHPTWAQVQRTMASYQPRTDERLVLDTTGPLEDSYQRLVAAVDLSGTAGRT